jgi:hypothetical protein
VKDVPINTTSALGSGCSKKLPGVKVSRSATPTIGIGDPSARHVKTSTVPERTRRSARHHTTPGALELFGPAFAH